MDQTVALVGTGRMGSALAAALFNKGFATTVWNRTAAKTAPLARLGLRVAPSVLDAVVQADVIVVNINDYHATQQLLSRAEIESALRGKTIVQLTTGTPDEAREMEAWARPLDIAYLDGAIMSNRIDIGKPTGTVVYSGSEELFRSIKPVLLAFGGNAMFIKSLMPVLEMMLTRLHGAIQSKDYDDTQASFDVWAPCPKELIKWCRKHGVDHSFVDPQLSLMEKAIQAGKGQADFAYLYEVLKGSN